MGELSRGLGLTTSGPPYVFGHPTPWRRSIAHRLALFPVLSGGEQVFAFRRLRSCVLVGPVARVPFALAFDRADRALSVRVGIEKDGDHHPRRERRRPGPTLPAVRLQCRQMHQADGIRKKVDEVRALILVCQVHWQKKPLPANQFPAEIWHFPPSLPVLRKTGNRQWLKRRSSMGAMILQQPLHG